MRTPNQFPDLGYNPKFGDEAMRGEFERLRKEDPDLDRKLDLVEKIGTDYEKHSLPNRIVEIVERKTGERILVCEEKEYWMLEILKATRHYYAAESSLAKPRPEEKTH